MFKGGVNKGSVVVVNEMKGTADNKTGVDNTPDLKNSTLNSGEQHTVKSQVESVKKIPF